MLQYKNSLNISELKNFFSSQENAVSKFFQILFSLSFTHAHIMALLVIDTFCIFDKKLYYG